MREETSGERRMGEKARGEEKYLLFTAVVVVLWNFPNFH